MSDADRQKPAQSTILDTVWGYHAGVTTHTLETHIYRLRQKIEADLANARLLMTVPGGYRLDLELPFNTPPNDRRGRTHSRTTEYTKYRLHPT